MTRSSSAFWHGKRVLVTGANGFVGGWLTRTLVNEGALVVAPVRDRVAGALKLHKLCDDVVVADGDVIDGILMERLLNEYEIDTVFHLAAQSQVAVANRHPVSTFDSNIRATWILLEQCKTVGSVARVIVSTSDKVYGDQGEPVAEDAPLLGRYPYDVSKVCADVIARCYATTYGLPVAVIRCANIYGGGDLNYSRIIPYAVRCALTGDTVVLRSSGSPCREYLYLDDAVRGLLRAAESIDAGGPSERVFNCGSGEAVSVMDLVQRIIKVVGRGAVKIVTPVVDAPHEIRDQSLISARAQSVLGWQPAIPLSEGLLRTVAWYRAHLGISS